MTRSLLLSLILLVAVAGLIGLAVQLRPAPRPTPVELEDLLAQIELRIAAKEPESAFALARETRDAWAADPMRDRAQVAMDLHRLGWTLYDDERIPEDEVEPALDLIADAASVALSLAPTDTTKFIEILEDGSTVHFLAGRTSASMELSRRRLELIDASSATTELDWARAWIDHAKVEHSAGLFDLITGNSGVVLPRLRRIFAEHPTDLADALALVGVSERALGGLRPSLELQREAFCLVDRAWERAETPDDRLRRQWVRQAHNFGTSLIDLEQYARAQALYEKIEAACQQDACAPNTQILYRKALGSLARRQLRLKEAEHRLQSLLDDLKSMEDVGPGTVGLVLDELGWVHRDARRWEQAEATFDAALDSLRREPERRRTTIVLTLRRRAETLGAQHRASEAHAAFEEALAARVALSGEDAFTTAVVRVQYAEWLVRDGLFDPDPAELLDRALPALEQDDERDLLVSYRANALATRARLYWAAGQQERAIDTMYRSIDDAESVRRVAGADGADRARVFSTRRDDIYDLMRWLHTLGRPEDAWRAFERARSRSLLDDLDSPRGLIESTLISDEESGAPCHSSESIGEDDEQVAVQDPVGLNEVRRELLVENGILLAYASSSERLALLVVRPGRPGFELRELSAAENLDPFQLLFGTENGQASAMERLRSFDAGWNRPLADRLHDIAAFLVPRDLWAELEATREIVVLPDGPWTRLPLDALVLEPAETARETTFAVDRWPAIRHAPSATALDRLRARGPAPQLGAATALVVADPALGPSAKARGLGPLPHARREVAILEQRVPGCTVLTGDEASEAAVTAGLRGAGLIHLATHGVVETRGWRSVASLLLANGSESAERTDDGWLDLDEVEALSLDAALTVLSACSSHDGELVAGEGVFALTRAFLAAGSARVVGTLWPVEDYATSWAMQRFYEAALRADAPTVAEALHATKRAIRAQEDWAAPAYWSSFVVTGLR